MCGICGVLNANDNPLVERERIVEMRDAMVHRGPDDCGVFLDGPCALGHRRLSIIDIATGSQPMIAEEDGFLCAIVFNGEVYNYQELRSELINLGHFFITKSDTEVILRGYKQWGESVVEKLRGMFAFAIWNGEEKELFIARDRMGIKPLYYFLSSDAFIFASEIKAILASGHTKGEIEPLSLDSFLTLGYVPGPLTMFKNIQKLMPGHTLTVEVGRKPAIRCYWDFAQIEMETIPFAEACYRVEELLKDSVKMRLMSEVPLGVFLSGGLDSSAVVALMSQVTDNQIKTFSVGYEGADEYSELAFARKVAKQYETDHYEFVLKPFDFLEFIPELVKVAEEPLVETAAIPLYQISRVAKEFATVLLSGEGGDEVFAGYGLYRKMLAIEKVAPLRFFFDMIPSNLFPGDKYKKYLDWLSAPLDERYKGISGDITSRIRREFYTEDFLKLCLDSNYLNNVFQKYLSAVSRRDKLFKMQYVDSKTWLADDLLLKADKMTMACAVELRVPFLDHKVVEFGATLAGTYKVNGVNGKFILKKVMEKYLPHEILYRRKMGFSVPTRVWFKGELFEKAAEILLSDTIMSTGFFQKKYIEGMLKRHRGGKEDYSRRIFSLLVLYHWLQNFIKN